MLAGSTRVPFWKFLIFDVMGALLWSGLFIGAGFLFGEHASAVGGWMRSGSAVLAAGLATGFGGYLAVNAVRGRRIRMGRRCSQ